MELREPIEFINQKLLEEYGSEYSSPIYRVVWSEDQFEKRFTDYTSEGFRLLEPEVRLLPKYRHYITAKYILEILVPVPKNQETDLITKVSYEPLWVFQDKKQNYLPPFYEGCKLIIESRLAAMNGSGYPKYKDKNETEEEYEARIQRVQNDLFGNETDVTDALTYGYGVGYTGKEFKGVVN